MQRTTHEDWMGIVCTPPTRTCTSGQSNNARLFSWIIQILICPALHHHCTVVNWMTADWSKNLIVGDQNNKKVGFCFGDYYQIPWIIYFGIYYPSTRLLVSFVCGYKDTGTTPRTSSRLAEIVKLNCVLVNIKFIFLIACKSLLLSVSRWEHFNWHTVITLNGFD